jgi:polysaccharide biosynthesis protein PslH
MSGCAHRDANNTFSVPGKRLLFVCSELPYPITKGIRVRQSTQIETLARQFEVSVAITHSSFKKGNDWKGSNFHVHRWTAPPKPVLANTISQILKPTDYYVAPPTHEGCHRLDLSKILSNGYFDLLWVSRLKSAWTLGRIDSVPCVFDLDEIESRTRDARVRLIESLSLRRRLTHAADIRALYAIERDVSKRYDLVTLSSQSDLNCLNLNNVRWLPNCAPLIAMPGYPGQASDKNAEILFIGTLEYDPNLHGIRWFLNHVWPDLLLKLPHATLHIVGEGGQRLPDLGMAPHTLVYGGVDDASEIWKRCNLAVVPIFAAGGTRIKILESWERGVAVVTTPVGVSGLLAVDGVHALIANDSSSFTNACYKVLTSSQLRLSLVEAGQMLVEKNYSRAAVEQRIAELAEEALSLYLPSQYSY